MISFPFTAAFTIVNHFYWDAALETWVLARQVITQLYSWLKGTVVNQTCHSMNGGTVEIIPLMCD